MQSIEKAVLLQKITFIKKLLHEVRFRKQEIKIKLNQLIKSLQMDEVHHDKDDGE